MKRQILNLEGVVVLTKQQRKSILGGNGEVEVCRVTCSNGSTPRVQNCANIHPSVCGDGVSATSCDCKKEPAVLTPAPRPQ